MSAESLIACHECDLLHRTGPLPEGASARCRRCGAVLYTNRRDSLDRTLALAITGLILFVVSNTFPFLAMKAEGMIQETTLISGVQALYQQGWPALAALVWVTTVLVPLVQITCLLYILLPLKLRRRPWMLARVFRFMRAVQPWQMMEVFMVGILVAMVKLAKMATIIPGVSVFSFAALIIVLVAAATTLEPRLVWDRLEAQ